LYFINVLCCCRLEQFGLAEADYYFYMNQSGCYKADGVDDVKEYQDTRVSILQSLLLPFQTYTLHHNWELTVHSKKNWLH